MVTICSLASGSKGNCTFVKTPQSHILIDVGLSLKELEHRLQSVHQNIEQIDAVLITHEHTDHIKGLKRLYEVYNVPIFCNAETAKGIYDYSGLFQGYKIFITEEDFLFKDLSICPFSIQHDTLDPVGFRIQIGNRTLVFCTDLGIVTPTVRANVSGADYLLLEANHEPSMVMACSRPNIYKERVLSRRGHLSNDSSVLLLEHLQKEKTLEHVVLAHLSQECNSAELALQKAQSVLKESTNIAVAKQDSPIDTIVL